MEKRELLKHKLKYGDCYRIGCTEKCPYFTKINGRDSCRFGYEGLSKIGAMAILRMFSKENEKYNPLEQYLEKEKQLIEAIGIISSLLRIQEDSIPLDVKEREISRAKKFVDL